MVAIPITEGTVVFKHPTLPKDVECRTWYKIHGSFSSGRRPLVTLHGGPGAPHLYLTIPFEDYAAKTGTPVVFYDQIGNGKSTHLREKRLDEGFWKPDLFIAELDNLLQHLGIRNDFDLYGHSWGTLLAAKYAVSPQGRSSGLRKMVLGSGPCRMQDWATAGQAILEGMPKEVAEKFRKYSKEGKYDAPEYKEALMEIYKKHMCRLDPWPQIVIDTFAQLEEDDTVYMTMSGPDEINTTGNLRDFDMSEECKEIKVPCLLINGEFDQCQDVCMKPWLKGIEKAKWVRLEGGAHMSHVEQPKRYGEIVWDFLGP